MASSRGRPGGHTSRPSLSELYSGRFPHGSEDGATAGRTPASAKVATYHPPAGARIPRSISRPLGVDSQNASPALGANVKSAGADSTRLVDWSTESTIAWLRKLSKPDLESTPGFMETMEIWQVDGQMLCEMCLGKDAMATLESVGIDKILARKKLVAEVKKLMRTLSQGGAQSQIDQSMNHSGHQKVDLVVQPQIEMDQVVQQHKFRTDRDDRGDSTAEPMCSGRSAQLFEEIKLGQSFTINQPIGDKQAIGDKLQDANQEGWKNNCQ